MQTRNKLANKKKPVAATAQISHPQEDEEMKQDELIGVKVISEPLPNPLAKKQTQQPEAVEESKE